MRGVHKIVTFTGCPMSSTTLSHQGRETSWSWVQILSPTSAHSDLTHRNCPEGLLLPRFGVCTEVGGMACGWEFCWRGYSAKSKVDSSWTVWPRKNTTISFGQERDMFSCVVRLASRLAKVRKRLPSQTWQKNYDSILSCFCVNALTFWPWFWSCDLR